MSFIFPFNLGLTLCFVHFKKVSANFPTKIRIVLLLIVGKYSLNRVSFLCRSAGQTVVSHVEAATSIKPTLCQNTCQKFDSQQKSFSRDWQPAFILHWKFDGLLTQCRDFTSCRHNLKILQRQKIMQRFDTLLTGGRDLASSKHKEEIYHLAA